MSNAPPSQTRPAISQVVSRDAGASAWDDGAILSSCDVVFLMSAEPIVGCVVDAVPAGLHGAIPGESSIFSGIATTAGSSEATLSLQRLALHRHVPRSGSNTRANTS